jgi:hypothetical protein
MVAVEQRVRFSFAPAVAGANFAYLPVIAWLLIPFTSLSFWAAFATFAALSLVLTVAFMWLLARRLGWSAPWLPALTSPLLWVSVWGLLLGQFDGILLAGMIGSILLRLRGRTLASGAVLAAVWLKPQLLLPAVPLLALSCWPDRRRLLHVLGGFGIVSVALLLLEQVATPGLLMPWWRYLHEFAADVPNAQFGLAGLTGLVSDLPRSWHSSDAVTGVFALLAAGTGTLLAAAVALRFAHRRAHSTASDDEGVVLAVMLPLAIWLLVTPYSHLNDVVLLFPLLMVIAGRDGARLSHWTGWALLAFFAMAPYAMVYSGFRFNPLPVVVLAVAVAGFVLGSRMAGLGAGCGPAQPPSRRSPTPVGRLV